MHDSEFKQLLDLKLERGVYEDPVRCRGMVRFVVADSHGMIIARGEIDAELVSSDTHARIMPWLDRIDPAPRLKIV